MIVALGIDVGSTTTKVVGVDSRGELAWHLLEESDPRMAAQARRMLDGAREAAGQSEVPLVATGYGRALVDWADRQVTEITCHARGVFRELGHGGTLIDIGGQDSKVIVIGEGGGVSNFAMNDKCAAGTGRFLEVVSRRLRLDMPELSNLALAAAGEVPISSTCTVFAESEMISLIAQGGEVDEIARGLHRAMIRRVVAMARSVGVAPPLILSGGVARSAAVCALLSEELGHEVSLPRHPQLMGAYGAALIAAKRSS